MLRMQGFVTGRAAVRFAASHVHSGYESIPRRHLNMFQASGEASPPNGSGRRPGGGNDQESLRPVQNSNITREQEYFGSPVPIMCSERRQVHARHGHMHGNKES